MFIKLLISIIDVDFSFCVTFFPFYVYSEEKIPECNIKVGYGLDGYDEFVGYAGSAHNCLSLVRLRKPEANGIRWQSGSKHCNGVSHATRFIETSYANNTQSCIIGSKFLILLLYIMLLNCVNVRLIVKQQTNRCQFLIL